ncbi:MAG: YraN family protein [Verrucomicrobiota bacterium]
MGVGEFGERVAVEWLWASGRKVLYRNFRASGGGEVDVVVREGKVLCFVEVKTRRRAGFGRPLEAVDKEKQALIERGANEWLKLLGTRDIPWRFDVVEVILEEGIPPQVTLVEDAF